MSDEHVNRAARRGDTTVWSSGAVHREGRKATRYEASSDRAHHTLGECGRPAGDDRIRTADFQCQPGVCTKGGNFPWWPWEGQAVPASLTFGGWLGGARHWHFAMMWLLVANALVYLGLSLVPG